jgi:spermidine synthase
VAQTEGVTAFGAEWRNWIIYLIMPLVLMLPPAILIGFYFPVAQKAIQTDYETVGRRVGLVKVANILGNATGGIVTGAILLHFWGTTGSLRVIGLLGLLFVFFWLLEGGHERLSRRLPVQPAALLLAGALLLTIFALPNANTIWGRLHGATATDLFLIAEDSTGVTALRRPLDNSAPAILFANGHSQATIPFLSLHGLLGALPALVHPQPERILIIGIGSAGTPYAAGANPLTQEITAVEIIGSELDVLRAYAGYEGGEVLGRFFADSRYRIIIGDGRRELALAQQTYDIIQADAIRPTSSHSGLLYSREFFETVRRKLAPGGIMTQWRATDRVEATFVSVFPYVINVGNFILLGSNEPIVYDPQLILDRLYHPQVVEYLAAGGYNVDQMRPWIDAQPVFWLPETPRFNHDTNSDLHPKDEYYLNK